MTVNDGGNRDPDQYAWDRQHAWSQTANRLKSQTMRVRTVSLVLTVAGAVLALTGSQVMEINEALGRILVFAAAAAIALVPVVQLKGGPSGVADWMQARSVSEALKTEVYFYLLRLSPYKDSDRGDQLFDVVAEYEKNAKSLTTSGVRSQQPSSPQVRDIRSYIDLRVMEQVNNYYEPRAKESRQRLRLVRAVEYGLAVLAALFAAAAGAFGVPALAAWVAVITTVGAALAAHAVAQRYEFEAIEYGRTASQLRHMGAQFRSKLRLSPVREPVSDQEGAEFVRECEGVISAQNAQWMAKWGAADKASTNGSGDR